MKCKYAVDSDYDCNCLMKQQFRQCTNAERLLTLNKRTDGAAFHSISKDGALLVPAVYCCREHCIDCSIEQCRHATPTNRKWARETVMCRVIECRAPEALEDATTGRWGRFRGMDGARFAIDANFHVKTDSEYIERRERFCNSSCPYFKSTDGEK